MKKSLKWKNFSIRSHIVVVALSVLLSVTALFAFFLYRVSKQINYQLAEANAETLEVFCTNLENQIRNAGTFLSTSLLDPAMWPDLTEETTVLDESVEMLLGNNTQLAGMFYVDTDSMGLLSHYGVDSDYTIQERETLEEHILAQLDQMSATEGWFVFSAIDRNFYCRRVNSDDKMLLCLVDFERVSQRAKLSNAIQGTLIFFQNKRILSNEKWLLQEEIQLEPNTDDFYFTGPRDGYLTVSKSLVGIQVSYLMPYENYTSYIGWLNSLPIMFFIFVIFAVAVIWSYLSVNVLQPMQRLINVMNHIQSGDLDARSPEIYHGEFKQVNDTFNLMLDKITALRIENYEKQMQAEKAQMETLRLQINPHFFLNCLKNIYGLATTNRTTDIQQLVLYLSQHLRYTFELSESTVMLMKELEMCHNYIKLMQMGDNNGLCLNVTMSPLLAETQVPLVSLLTLVENSIKHGSKADKQLEISISVRQIATDEERWIEIIVADNGVGFSPEMLSRLNRRNSLTELEGHVGLVNVYKRFRLLYGERFTMSFSNNNGAKVELFFSIDRRNKNEAVDC